MSARPCCARRTQTGAGAGTGAATIARRGVRAASWLLPGALLALVPKCPACFAAYFALATGIGISAAAAQHLRTGLVVLCIGAIAALAIRAVRRRVH